MIELPESFFCVYALSLPQGLSFGEDVPKGAWQSDDGFTCGVLTQNESTGSWGALVMRRREDDVWTVNRREAGMDREAASKSLRSAVKDRPKEPMPRGVARRPSLGDLKGVNASKIFQYLASPTHHVAAWMLNQLYLSLPRPDPNWASDCQTGNFHTRLWEAHLLACFREQGLHVAQDHPSPDFHIRNPAGEEAWIEAVTANPPIPFDHFNAPPTPEPPTRQERVIGPAAVRFAKTIRSKLMRRYDELPHVAGKPFAIALADFHAPGSMVWSRIALPSYLYGQEAKVVQRDGVRVAEANEVDTLLGSEGIPAGLFRTAEHSYLSAVIFSNACSISKLNRVGVSAGARSEGYRYVRFGEFYDRTPGATRGMPFVYDITTPEYRKLWPPYDYEPWSAELEVFHNPFARHPIPDSLLPEATHWRMVDGEGVCRSFYEKSVLRSRTLILPADAPVPTVDELFKAQGESEEEE